jgi:methylphosphotriester-DNA--protein-cysteine methyltransferase
MDRMLSFATAHEHHAGGRSGRRPDSASTKIRAHSRHRTIATLMIYIEQHDREQTQRSLADLVAGTITI